MRGRWEYPCLSQMCLEATKDTASLWVVIVSGNSKLCLMSFFFSLNEHLKNECIKNFSKNELHQNLDQNLQSTEPSPHFFTWLSIQHLRSFLTALMDGQRDKAPHEDISAKLPRQAAGQLKLGSISV